MKYLVTFFTAALAFAQTPAVSIRPHTSALPGARVPTIGLPILGYLPGPGSTELRAIIGVPGNTQLGRLVPAPAGATGLFLAPRQHYALIENANGEFSIWLPAKTANDVAHEPSPLTVALAHPDSIVFSVHGDSAIFYSKSADRLQVISGLPGQPVVKSLLRATGYRDISNFAVSDDGSLVVAQLADSNAIISANGANWQRLAAGYGAAAWLFLPRTHTLVLSEPARQMVSALDLAAPAQNSRPLTQGIAADRLAVTADGQSLLAASATQGKVWTLNLLTDTLGPASSYAVESLVPLRDGQTFLLSSSPALSLLHVPPDANASH